ncbi:MAG: hypothetical protein R3B72_40205 [Polyangiaceae bacterium]
MHDAPAPLATHVTAGYGGVGPQGPPGVPDAHIALVLDLRPEAEAAVDAIELVEAAGEVVARALPPLRHRVERSGGRRQLHVAAPLDAGLASLFGRQPIRYRARVRAGEEVGMVGGPLDPPCATAGPAAPP